MRRQKQVIKIIREKGTIRMVGNGDQKTWLLANGMYNRGEIKPRKIDEIRRFFRCLVKAIRWEAREKSQAINKAVVGTEEAVTEFYPSGGYLNRGM